MCCQFSEEVNNPNIVSMISIIILISPLPALPMITLACYQCNLCDMKLGQWACIECVVNAQCVIRNPTALQCTGDSFVQMHLAI